MRSISRARPSPALVVAVLALVAAVAGTAVAEEATTSAKPVTKSKVKKIADKEINKLAPGLSVANAANAANADALDGQSAADLQSVGRGFNTTGSCDPGDTTFITCISVDLNLPSPGRVLLVGDVGWYVNGAPSRGRCGLFLYDTTGGAIGGAIAADIGESVDTTSLTHQNGQGLNAVTGVAPAGPHTARLVCNQEAGDIVYRDLYVSAVRLGAG